MIHVVFLIRKLDLGGAERQLTWLAQGLNPNRFRVTVLTFYRGGEFTDSLTSAGISVRSLEKRHRWDVVGFQARIVAELRALKPNIVQSYQGPPNLAALLARRFAPDTSVIWGIRGSNMDLSEYDYTRKAVFRLERRLSHLPDLIIANSFAGRDYVTAQGFAPGKLQVIPNGIDIEVFKPDPIRRANLRKAWGFRDDTIVVGMVARLDPKKDHSTYLKAASLLSREYPHVRFVCVGHGDSKQLQTLQTQVRSLDLEEQFIWKPPHDAPAAFNAFDISTLSSAYGEGFPNVVAESMACEIPCVATDTGDAALIIDNNDLVVPPRDPTAMAAAWKLLLDLDADSKRSLRKRIRKRVASLYSIERMVQSTARAYEELASR